MITRFLMRVRKRIVKACAPHNLHNTALVGLACAGVVAIELLIGGTLFEINPAKVEAYGLTIPLALPWGALSVVLGLLGTLASAAATQASLDPRPEEKARATGLRLVALGAIVVPIFLLAQALSWPLQVAAHADYVAGSLFASDKATVADPLADARLVALAQERLVKWELPPSRPSIDFWMFWQALAIYGLVALAPGFLVRAAPETAGERKRREIAERTAKAQATRQANEKAEAQRKAERNAKRRRKGSGWAGNVFRWATWPPARAA
jgi:hypothetical protein